MITWNDYYKVEIKRVDRQHHILVDLLNNAYDVLVISKDFSRLPKIINLLKEYTILHFSDEEKIMENCSFPEIEEHKREHEFFVKKLEDLTQKLEKDPNSLTLEIYEFLKNWLLNHILWRDKKLAIFAREECAKLR